MCKLSESSGTSSQTVTEPKPSGAEGMDMDFPPLASSLAKTKKGRTRSQKLHLRRPEEASVSLPPVEETEIKSEELLTTGSENLKALPPDAIAQMPHPMQALLTRLASSSDSTQFTAYLPDDAKQLLSNGLQQADGYPGDESSQPYEDDKFVQTTCSTPDIGDWDTFQEEVHPQPTYMITYDEGYTWWPWTPEVCTEGFTLVPVQICSFPIDAQSDYCTQDSECTEPAQSEHYQESACPDVVDISQIKGDVWKLSKSQGGTRCVQEAFESTTLSTAEKLELALELHGHAFEACRCRHANHALQKCIVNVPADHSQFIVDEIMMRKGGALQIAKNQCGCRILQRLLEHCSIEQMREIVEELVSHTVVLSTNQFGNFVISHILQFCEADIAERVIEKLVEIVAQVESPGDSRDEGSQGSHDEGPRGRLGSVLDTAFDSLQPEVLTKLANEVVSRKDFLADLACSRFGHKAALKAFSFADKSVQRVALIALRSHTGKLRNRYGKPLLKMVEEHQSWGARKLLH